MHHLIPYNVTAHRFDVNIDNRTYRVARNASKNASNKWMTYTQDDTATTQAWAVKPVPEWITDEIARCISSMY
jgi:hypothetical protein